MDKQSLPQLTFDGDAVPAVFVEDPVDSAEGHLNLSGDSAISGTSVVSSTYEPTADIVSLCSCTLHFHFHYYNYGNLFLHSTCH